MEKGEKCPRCRGEGRVFVHGHEQCTECKCNVEECCQGEKVEEDN